MTVYLLLAKSCGRNSLLFNVLQKNAILAQELYIEGQMWWLMVANQCIMRRDNMLLRTLNNGRNLMNWFNTEKFDKISGSISDFLESKSSNLYDDFTASFGVPKGFSVDITESDVGYELSADLPGLSKDDIDLKLEDGVLCISCERSNTNQKTGPKLRFAERKWGKFSRSFSIPDVDENSIEANLTDGVLTIKMKKKLTNEKVKVIKVT